MSKKFESEFKSRLYEYFISQYVWNRGLGSFMTITLAFPTVLCRKGTKMYKLQFLVTKSGKNWMLIFFQIQNYQIMCSYIYWNSLKVTRSFVLACDLQMKCFKKCIILAHSMTLFWLTLQWFNLIDCIDRVFSYTDSPQLVGQLQTFTKNA